MPDSKPHWQTTIPKKEPDDSTFDTNTDITKTTTKVIIETTSPINDIIKHDNTMATYFPESASYTSKPDQIISKDIVNQNTSSTIYNCHQDQHREPFCGTTFSSNFAKDKLVAGFAIEAMPEPKVWRMRDGDEDEDEDEKSDGINYEMLQKTSTHQSKALTIRSEYITIRPSMILLLLAQPDQAHKSKFAYLAAGSVLQVLENQLLSASLLICLGKHDCVERIPS
ncbi:hypothetical protein Tco_1367430, partial [Tanacetum coccineum]